MAQNPTASESVTATPGCTVEKAWSGRIAVLSVAGTLDMLTAGALQDAVETTLRDSPAALIIDLTAVDFLASAGMSVLIGAGDAAGADISFFVVAHGPVTARPLTLTGITEIIAVHPTLDEALSAAME